MNMKKFSLLDRSLFWLNNKEYVLTSNGPGAFGLIFRDGDKYLVDGTRVDVIHFEFIAADLRRLSCGSKANQKDFGKIVKILKEELESRGMIISVVE